MKDVPTAERVTARAERPKGESEPRQKTSYRDGHVVSYQDVRADLPNDGVYARVAPEASGEIIQRDDPRSPRLARTCLAALCP